MPLYRADCANRDPNLLSMSLSEALKAATDAVNLEPKRIAKVYEYMYWKDESDCPNKTIFVYDPSGVYS